jgi:hypothetical protein
MDIKMKSMSRASNLKSPDLLNRWRPGRFGAIKRYFFSLKGVLIATAVLSFAIAGFIFVFHKKQLVDPNVALANETNELAANIGKFMELPVAEQPTLATVTDKAKLRGQDFFQHAEDGDKVLVYSRSKKVILYRPSTGKIIDVTNLTSGVSSSQ